MVFGAERNFVVALITLDPDGIAGWAKENGMAGQSYTDLVRSEAVKAMIGDYVDDAQRPAQPVGDHQEVGAPRPRPDHRVR